MSKVWGIGMVGTGLIADMHARAIESLSNARLVGVCSRRQERAREVAAKYGVKAYVGVEAMLSDGEVEVVAVINASGAHLEPTVAAAQAGRHVMCEKPLEVTLERVDAMIEAHAKAGTRLGGIFQSRYHPAVQAMATAVREGRFGTLSFGAAWVPWWRDEAYFEGSWHGTVQLDGGGSLMNQAIHTIDLLGWMLGPAEEVRALAATRGHAIEVEDTAAAVLRFAGGALGAIYGTTASWPGRQRRLEVTGTKGTAVLEGDGLAVWRFADERAEDEEIRRRWGDVDGPGGVSDPGNIQWQGHAANWAGFLRAVETGEAYELDGVESRKAVELVLRVYEAASLGSNPKP